MQVTLGTPAKATTPTALTIGNFDGLHLGHRAMLEKFIATARARGLPTTVLTFEPHPREFFAPDQAPARLTSLREKLTLMQQTGIDRVHVMRFNAAVAAETPDVFINDILLRGFNTRYLIIGDDFCFGKGRSGNLATLQTAGAVHGFDVEAMHTVEIDGIRVSSSSVRDALLAGELCLAKKLLGRAYNVAGRVIHGDKIGRTMGFPTANVQLRRRRVPLSGIFAVTVDGLGPQALPGAASVGVRPTIGEGLKPVLEVHLLNFNRDVYQEHVSVNFLHKLRDEAKYESLDALKQQIARDVEATADYFAGRNHG